MHLRVLCLAAVLLPGAVSTAQSDATKTTAGGAPPEPRVALVIGNETYASMDQLSGVAAQSTKMAHMLGVLGFHVYSGGALLNQGRAAMRDDFRSFAQNVPAGALVWIYYSGHGQDGFLIPNDAPANVSGRCTLHCVKLQELYDDLEASKAKAIVFVIDACRSPDVSSRVPGIAAVPPDPPDRFLVAFPTKSSWPQALNSRYTASLIARMGEQGLDLEQLFRQVAKDVESPDSGENPITYDTLPHAPIYLIPAAARDDWDFHDVPTPDFKTANPNFALAEPYLEQHGISLSTVTPGADVSFIKSRFLYSGSSEGGKSENVLRQDGPQCNLVPSVTFTLHFNPPVKEFRFRRARLLAESVHGISQPSWEVRAYGADGRLIAQDTAGEDLIRFFPPEGQTTGTLPEKEFTVKGPNLAAITFTSSNRLDGKVFAAFCSVQISGITVITGPVTTRDDRDQLLSVAW